jgi:hypothetical protein
VVHLRGASRNGVTVSARDASACLALFFLVDCGGLADKGSKATGGPSPAASETGGTGSSSGDSSVTGGSATGGFRPTLVPASEAVTGGTSGAAWDDADTEGCPSVPANKLAPYLEPFLSGPDPGPCQSSADPNSFEEGTTYEYDALGRLVGRHDDSGAGRADYLYEGDLMVQIVEQPGLTWNLTYESGVFIHTEAGAFRGYLPLIIDQRTQWVVELDSRGYPRRSTLSRIVDGLVYYMHLYEYDDCRIVRATPDWKYSYDTEGHLMSFTSATETLGAYDYSCWQ